MITVALVMSGDVTCKIGVVGPRPVTPATVSSSSATGKFATCAAQAGPGPHGMATWRDARSQLLGPARGSSPLPSPLPGTISHGGDTAGGTGNCPVCSGCRGLPGGFS